MDILDKVISVIAEVLNAKKEDIKKETKLEEDLGADAFDVTEIVMALEVALNISMSDEEIEKMITIEDLTNYVSSLVEKESGN